MLAADDVMMADARHIAGAAYLPWERLRGKTVLITGATGLIGSALLDGLLLAQQVRELHGTVLALCRDEVRARRRFARRLSMPGTALRLAAGSVERLPDLGIVPDYIIHAAGPTASRAFAEQPVETIHTALAGTKALLELARAKHGAGMVYLSSMEVYGSPPKGRKTAETEAAALYPLAPRSSYPISKLQCENLVCAYAAEYGVPGTIVRLAQTFGPGVRAKDARIFAEFGRCVREKRDIVLRTGGETERSYLYTADAATAILTVLLKGRPGQAYNAADEGTYCSVAQMARRVAALGGVRVRYEPRDPRAAGYLPALAMDLDTARLRALGWAPGAAGHGRTLEEMYTAMIAAM